MRKEGALSEASLSPPPTTGPHETAADSGRASDLPVPPDIAPEKTLSAGQWGMVAFLVSEAALFSTLIVTYLSFLGKDTVGPTPAKALSLGLVLCTTACLLSSSVTVHLAERALGAGSEAVFRLWWAITIVLGLVFVGLGLVTDGLYALGAGTAAGWLRASPRFLASERWVSGGMYIGLGVAATFAGHARK